MHHGRLFFFIAVALATTTQAVSSDELRTWFEWGQYREIVNQLEPYLANPSDSPDTATCARYHLFLGVALYGIGRAGDAQKHFLTALQYDPLQRPDRRYISEEIDNLFSVTLSDFTEAQRRNREKDSLMTARQRAFDANMTKMRKEELHRGRIAGTVLSVSLFSIGAAFAGIAAYEYYSVKQPYRDFRAAAAGGDRMEYDRLQPIIRRANGIIVGCAISAGISEVAALFMVIRTSLQKKTAGE